MTERSRFRPPSATAVLTGIVLVILLWLVLYPSLFVLADSFLDGGRATGEHYARFLGSRSEREALWNGVWISLANAFVASFLRRANFFPATVESVDDGRAVFG